MGSTYENKKGVGAKGVVHQGCWEKDVEVGRILPVVEESCVAALMLTDGLIISVAGSLRSVLLTERTSSAICYGICLSKN